MSWNFRWKRPATPLPNINIARYRMELPGGKQIHGNRMEMVALGRQHGIETVYDRQAKTQVWIDLHLGQIRKVAPVAA